MGLNRNINDDSTLAYLFNKTRQGASDALQKAIDAINATIATIQTALNNKVSKAGDTMTGELRINDNNFVIKNSVADITAASLSAQQNNWYRVYDKNGRTLANFDATQETNGTIKARIYANNRGTGTDVSNALTLSVASNGTRTVSVTQPSAWRDAIGAVNKAGDTMTGNLEIELSGTPHFYLDNNLADTSLATDTATRQWSIYHKDKNGKVISYWESTFNTAGTAATSFRARRIVNGSSADNGVNFSITADGTRSVSVSSPAAWRTALGLGSIATVASPVPIANGGTGQTEVTKVTTVSSVITAASGITISKADYVVWGKVAQFFLQFKRSSAISVPADGNITDIQIGTLASGKRPATYTTVLGTGAPQAWGFADANGKVVLTAMEATGSARTIAANTVIEMYATYILA